MTDESMINEPEAKQGKGRRSGSMKTDPVPLADMPDVMDLRQLGLVLGKSYQTIVKTDPAELPPVLPMTGHRKFSKKIVQAWLDKNGQLTTEDLQQLGLPTETDSGNA